MYTDQKEPKMIKLTLRCKRSAVRDDSNVVRRTERMWTETESSEETRWGLHMGKASSTSTGKGQAAAGARNSASLNHKAVIQCARCLKEQV